MTRTILLSSLDELIERVIASRSYSNDLDIAIDIALFKPDREYVSVKPNSAGTKLVYTLADGNTRTHLAEDHTLTGESRNRAIRLLNVTRAALSNRGEHHD